MHTYINPHLEPDTQNFFRSLIGRMERESEVGSNGEPSMATAMKSKRLAPYWSEIVVDCLRALDNPAMPDSIKREAGNILSLVARRLETLPPMYQLPKPSPEEFVPIARAIRGLTETEIRPRSGYEAF